MFELIICTYNRPELAMKLALDALNCNPAPDSVVIVDATPGIEEKYYTTHSEKIRVVHSSHKNQPYQRYLGFLASSAEQLVYFDDDVKILDTQIFRYLIEPLFRNEVEGACIKVRYENVLHSLLDKQGVKQGGISALINKISGVPAPSMGKLGLVGVPGPLPHTDAPVEFFQGTNMAFTRAALKNVFDDRVFSQYECKLGKGEDKVISFKVSSLGTLWYSNIEALHHPPVETSYFDHSLAFSKRMAYSRYFLSKVYCEEKNYPWWLGKLHYYYFMMWRISLAGVNFLRTRKDSHKDIVKGMWQGMILTLKGRDAYNSCQIDWEREARRDIEGR